MRRRVRVCACIGAALVFFILGAGRASATSYTAMGWGGSLFGTYPIFGNGSLMPSGGWPVASAQGLTGITSISSSYQGSIAVTSGGAYAWGENGSGEIGTHEVIGPDNCSEPPAEAPCAKTPRLVSLPETPTAVSAGGAFDLALLPSGKVMAWGDNRFGQLGTGELGPAECVTGACNPTPTEVKGLKEVIAISAGYYHAVALLKDGTVMTWGLNETGQLGDGSTTNRLEPVKVEGLGGEAVAVSAGYAESMALLSNGTVRTWGGNGHGQLGQEERPVKGPRVCGTAAEPCSVEPLTVNLSEKAVAIAAGYWDELALMENGTVKSWGSNERGYLGIGATEGPETCPFPNQPCSSTPETVKGLSEVKSIASTSAQTTLYALLNNETVMAWGSNEVGGLGLGTTTGPEVCSGAPCSSLPVRVHELMEVGAIAAGGANGFALIPEPSAPEFGRCVKVTTGVGQFEHSNCTPGGVEKKFEWYPSVEKRGFTTAAGESTLETARFGVTLRCTTESGSGEYSGRTTLSNVVMKFHGCEEGLPAGKCTSPGAAEGEVVTHSLSGVLGVAKTSPEGPSKNKLALRLSPSTGAFAEFTCPGGGAIVVRGSVMVPVTANTVSLTPPQNFKSAGGKQKPEKFEGGPISVLEQSIGGEPYEQAGLNSSVTQTNEEKVEASSVN